jgi:hypothetical protein
VFNAAGADELSSATLVDTPKGNEERPWAMVGPNESPLTTNGLARPLRPFGITPKGIRIGATTPNGYEQASFEDAWRRYLTEELEPGAEGANMPDAFSPGTRVSTATPRQQQQPQRENPDGTGDSGRCCGVAVGDREGECGACATVTPEGRTHEETVAMLLAAFPGATVVEEPAGPAVPLESPDDRHVVAPCSVCGEATIIGKGTTPVCRLTPRCPGQHGAKPGTTRKTTQERVPRQRKIEDVHIDPRRFAF